MCQQEEEDSREVNVGEEMKDGGKGRPTVSNPMTVCHGAVIANAWVDGHQRCTTAAGANGLVKSSILDLWWWWYTLQPCIPIQPTAPIGRMSWPRAVASARRRMAICLATGE